MAADRVMGCYPQRTEPDPNQQEEPMAVLPVDLEPWPPALSPPDVTLSTMLDWMADGCEWPVSGDRVARGRTPTPHLGREGTPTPTPPPPHG